MSLLCLGNCSNNFSADNVKMTRLYRYVYYFSVNYKIDVADILDIHKYLMVRIT